MLFSEGVQRHFESAVSTGIVAQRGQREFDAAGSVELTRNLFAYIPWIDKFVALLWEARRTCAMVEKLNVPCHAVQSARDEMVSLRSCKVLKKNPGIGVTVMEHSGHFGYEEAEKEKVLACFSHLLGEL